MKPEPKMWSADRRIVAVVGTLMVAGGVAVADGLDARGWSEGEAASTAARVLQPLDTTEALVPPELARKVKKPTLVVYFSPTCPHCKRVAPELQALHDRLQPKAQVLGVATRSATPESIEAFRKDHGVTFPIIQDTTSEIASSLSMRSTPSAALLERDGKKIMFKDVWYPYAPGTDVLVEMRLADTPWDVFTEGRYLGDRTCGSCHRHEIESWMLTHHSIAWRTLVEHDATKKDECTSCHVTGAGTGGWDGSADSRLVNVGCEACHGSGGPHDGVPTDPKSTCEGCHDAKHSIGFRYEKGLPLIDHFRSAGLTDDQWVSHRKDLLNGKVEQSLLTFDEGTYVGASACVECHASETEHWKSSPHAHAMKTLAAGGTDSDPGCVACHATQKVVGPRPASLDGFHVEEAVGCEACHGPGGAHVAAKGGTDNIVGLGDSCPVCVIEAVCTSCHTTAWDADWDLDVALPKVGHGSVVPVPKSHSVEEVAEE